MKNNKKNEKDLFPSQEEVDKFKMLEGLIESITLEMKEFAKKKPDETLNKFKTNTINNILKDLKEIMRKEATNDYLVLLDKDVLPSNSDAVIVIGQYNSAISQFRAKYNGKTDEYSLQRWFTQENPGTHYKQRGLLDGL